MSQQHMYPLVNRGKSCSNCQGFSITELLVVLTVIFAMTGLILAVLQISKVRPQVIGEITSMRQLSVAA